jgi:penicillin-binding protein 1A
VTQGASTITQQLARQTFNLKERSYKRKLLEAFVAQRIEAHFSKSEILELYLNRIFFGANFYGIQAASRGYFGKDAKDLIIEESATIAGLIKSPNNIQPLKHPERALKERNWVLERMVLEGTLKRDEAERLKKKPVVPAPQTSDPRLSYVFDNVRQQVVALVGEERASIGGFMIYTSIDKDIQKAAEDSVKQRLSEVEKRPKYEHQTFEKFQKIYSDYRTDIAKGRINPATPRPKAEYLQGAALVMDNNDGSILAMVGGRDFLDSQYNRATDGLRPVGTAFTPFVYAAAFSRPDYYPMTPLEDVPLDNRRVMIGGLTGILGEWGAEVAEPKWSRAQISAREALVNSHNSATVRVGERVALDGGRVTPQFQSFATRAGIQSPLREYPSTFLGASEAKLDEMTLAYSCFPTLGKRPAKLHLIQRITDGNDKLVFQIEQASVQPVRAMDEIAAYQTHSCLVDALRRGTGAAAGAEFGLGDFPAGGKTGTHYEYKDLWYFGYTSAVTCGVWVGFDKQKTIYPGAFSNRIALPIWTDIINVTAKSNAPQEISPPESAERVEICRKSGLRATDFCYEKIKGPDKVEKSVRNTYFEYLRPESNFNMTCTVHNGEGLPADLAVFHHTMNANADIAALADAGKFAHIEPVHVRDVVIIGSDPYDAEQPVLRARPVNEDGTPIRHAVPVDPHEGDPKEEPVLKLKPPPPMKIEF